MAFQQYNTYPGLTPVRLVSMANVAGTYFNGSSNNGVGATLTVAASSLTVDSVLVAVGDRVLLVSQTSAFQNGIYVVLSVGTTVVLQRAADMQNIEQMHSGQYVSVQAGSSKGGTIFVLVEPFPISIGVSSIVWVDNGVTATLPTILNNMASFSDTLGNIKDSGITAASLSGLLAATGSGSSVRSATFSGSGATATTVITDAAITAASVVIARFVSSANVVTVQTVLPAAGQVTVVSDAAPSTNVIEYISFTPSAALLAAGVVVGKGSYGGGSATFVIADANITAGMVVTSNFQSQVTPSKVYTALAGAGTITFVTSANPGVCVIEYAAMLPGDISALGLHAANYAYAGGFASIVIADASITAQSVVTAEFKSQSVVALIQKVTPSAGTLTVLASIDPGPSVVAYIATASSGSGTAAAKTASDNAQPVVSSVVGATVANALAVFADVAGSVKAQTVASTLGFGLTISTGNFDVSAGTMSASGDITSSAGNFVNTAGYYLNSVVNGLTALAGGAQAGTALTRQINRVTTVATAADSVQLPAAVAGRVVTVINAAAANAMAVFPQTGEIINALAANASISVVANKTINFYCAVAGTWNSLLTA